MLRMPAIHLTYVPEKTQHMFFVGYPNKNDSQKNLKKISKKKTKKKRNQFPATIARKNS